LHRLLSNMKYKLKRDLPWAKAGNLWKIHEERERDTTYMMEEPTGLTLAFPSATFPDWFEEVDERWKPKPLETYWMVTTWTGDIAEHTWGEDDLSDKWLMHAMNVFRTEELAQRAAEQIKALLKEFHKNNP